MAELLDQNEIFGVAFEPKQTNRFIMYIDGIPSFMIKKVSRPSVSSGKVTIDHMNIKRHFKGKTEWQDVTMTLYDPISPSAAQAAMEWFRLSHESVTGRNGYADFYKKNVVINVIGPVGDKVEEWELRGAFPTAVTPSEVDYGSEGAMTIDVTLAIDYAILQY